MYGSRWTWRYCARAFTGLAGPVLLSLVGNAAANPPRPELLPAPAAAAARPAPAAVALDLAACRALASQQQPAIAAAHASLAAAVTRAQALDNLRVPTFLARDLPTRRQQAALGVVIAQAGVQSAEINTRYAVDYSYLTALYSLEQQKVADEAIFSFEQLVATVEATEKAGKRRDITRSDVFRVQSLLRVARARREEALQGVNRALSALREALGVGPDCPLTLAHAELFRLDPPVVRQQILGAVTGRPELVVAVHGAEVTGLEVCAQGARRLSPTVPTFASGSDIHSQPLPAGSYDDNYKPSAVGPEMPVTLNGRRADRVELARVYAGRAETVVEKTRSLLVLEAEQAYFKWAEAKAKLPHYEQAAKDAFRARENLAGRFSPLVPGVTVDQLTTATILYPQVRAQANLTRYQLLLALAQLERATAGGFCAGLDTAPLRVGKNQPGGNNKGQPGDRQGGGGDDQHSAPAGQPAGRESAPSSGGKGS